MKHTLKITIFLVLMFFFAQIIGLVIVNEYFDISQTSETGKTVVNEQLYEETGMTPPPPVEDESGAPILMIFFAILFGTIMILLLIRFRLGRIWKLWFFIAIYACLYKAFIPFISMTLGIVPGLISWSLAASFIIAGIFSYLKVFRPNIYVHNFTEIFVYGGLASIVLNFMNIIAAFGLLVLISIYDMYAVWKSKHMVKMAKFQTQSKLFAGLMLPYEHDAKVMHSRPVSSKAAKKEGTQVTEKTTKTAILGGGDVAFPLLFAGALLKASGIYTAAFIVVIATSIALFLLLYMAEKDKFYPAMPFISAGCVAGFVLAGIVFPEVFISTLALL